MEIGQKREIIFDQILEQLDGRINNSSLCYLILTDCDITGKLINCDQNSLLVISLER